MVGVGDYRVVRSWRSDAGEVRTVPVANGGNTAQATVTEKEDK